MSSVIYENGRVTIPADVRRRLGLKPGDKIELVVEEGEVSIRPVRENSDRRRVATNTSSFPRERSCSARPRKIGATGFGQQRRISVAFHRLLMPDGYSVDLDQFHGLDQIGEECLKDQVNNHYLQIFGTSIALGVIAGAAQISQGGSNLTSSGPQSLTNGAASSVSQSGTTILDRFIQIPLTITIREGHRVKIYFTQDILLPAYENHRTARSF